MDDKVTQVCWSPDDTTKSLLIRCPILSSVDGFVFAVLGFDLNLTNFSLAMNPFIIPEIIIKQKLIFFGIVCWKFMTSFGILPGITVKSSP